jgi:predicted Zn-dependent protease
MSMPSDAAAGRLSDGRTAAAAPVRAWLSADGVEFSQDGETQAHTWPYAALRCAVPLTARSRDVLLSLAPTGAETLFVADPAFVRALKVRAPALSAGRQRWHALRPALAVVAVVAAIGFGVRVLHLHPAQALARLMPQPTREAIGRNVIASLTRTRKPCETPAARAAIDRLTTRLATAAADRPPAVRVILVDWQLVNAFAVPGGQIILTRGLVQKAQSPDEVAGVLAHELGHVLELHPEASLVRAVGLSAAVQLILAGSSGALSNIGVLLTQMRYTRVAEREADAQALRILKNAGVSSAALGDFFERLEGKPAAPATGTKVSYARRLSQLELLHTHPLTADRIAMVRAQPPYPATPALADADWRALRDACTLAFPAPTPPVPQAPSAAPAPRPAATSRPAPPSAQPAAPPPNPRADRDIAEATTALAANPADVAALRKRAHAYGQKRQFDLALADSARAAALKPDDAALQFDHGVALQTLRHYEEAVRAYDAALRIAPNHLSARNNRGIARLVLKRYDEALADFDEVLRVNPQFAPAYYNRALVYRATQRREEAIGAFTAAIAVDGDYAAAYAQRGLLHEAGGRRDEAVADFRAALGAPAKYDTGAWAHTISRERLKALGEATP